MSLLSTWASSLMRLVRRGDFGRGENPHFLGIHVLADA